MTIYALLVGINKYLDEKKISELKGCENDVDLFAETLTNRFGKKNDDGYLKIKTLKTTEATRPDVIRSFKSHLIDQVGEADIAVFYFSGHGAQSLTHRLLKDEEPDGLDESLVCYDSRHNGRPDLRDKDLSHLLSELEDTGCKHIAVFLDSCHSGHGTRVIGSEEQGSRLTDIDETEHPWQSYLFAEDKPTPTTVEEAKKQLPKHAKHLLMSGCRDDQLSIEQKQGANGKYHGLFTYALCEALNTIQYPVSYHELRSRAFARIQSKYPNQTPQLEAAGGAEGLEPILGGDNLLPVKLLVTYDKKNWVVNVGAMHGFHRGDELAVFSSEQVKDTSAVPKAIITGLTTTKSILKIVDADQLDKDQQYNAVVTYRKFEKVGFSFKGADEKLTKIQQLLSEADSSDASVAGHFLTLDASNPDYELHFDGSKYFATLPNDYRPLFEKQEFDYKALDQLAIMARWRQKLDIENPSSFLAQENLVETSVSYFDYIKQKWIEDKSEDITLNYVLNDNGIWKNPEFTIKFFLKDTSAEKNLYCSFLWFDAVNGAIYDDFSPSPGLLSNKEGASITEVFANQSSVIGASIADELHDQGITKIQDTLKVFISEEEFDISLLTQQGNDLFDSSKNISEQHRSSNGLPSVLDVLANTVHHRAPTIKVEKKVKVFDWYTKSINLTIIRPQEARVVSSSESIILASDGSKSIKVEPHPTFKGSLRTINLHDEASTNIDTDKAPSITQPRVFSQGVTSAAVSFSEGRDTDMGLDAVEVFLGPSTKGADNAGEVSPDSPLVFTLDEQLQRGEYIIPYTYDEENEFFLPIGKSISKDGTTQIKIELIPEQIAKASPGTKSLGRALKVYFRKLIFQDILGEEVDIHQLRVPELDGDNLTGQIKKYESNKAVIKEKVEKSQKILLVLHGIIGATDSLVGFVNHELEDGSSLEADYDLVLAFDYENLNTPIKEIAEALKANLQSVGIAAGTDKQVDIVAHSMGGLVSRYLIEHDGGDQIINKLVMVGTPNGGSPYASVKDKGVDLLNTWAYTNVAIILNGLTSPLVGATVIGGFMKLLDQIDNNLDQMAPDSDFLKVLVTSEQPDTDYSLVAGFIHEEKVLVNQDDSRLSRLFQYLGGHLKLKAYEQLTERLFKESNDIAASSSSMNSFNPTWQKTVSVKTVSCDHLSYFADAEAINLIASQLRKSKAGVIQ